MAIHSIKGLIFDFDGLLVETESPAFQAWQEIFAEHGCELPLGTWAQRIGGTTGEFDPCVFLEEQIKRPVECAVLVRRRWQRKSELCANLPLLPGVGDYLSAARTLNLKLGLASSSPQEWVVAHLERLGLSTTFDCVVCADDVSRIKPDPELYQTALSWLGLRAEEVIAIEDSPNGVLAATRAGLFCVVVPNALTGQLPLDHADLRLRSLADLPLPALLEHVHTRRAGSTQQRAQSSMR
ncbi:MAG: HAD family hydrolase [Chloroflexota bacterium]|nr:HAD family hydrolase [Chloroflexota bacterium]